MDKADGFAGREARFGGLSEATDLYISAEMMWARRDRVWSVGLAPRGSGADRIVRRFEHLRFTESTALNVDGLMAGQITEASAARSVTIFKGVTAATDVAAVGDSSVRVDAGRGLKRLVASRASSRPSSPSTG